MVLKFDMGHGHKSHSDMRHDHFLKSTGDMGTPRQGPQRGFVRSHLIIIQDVLDISIIYIYKTLMALCEVILTLDP